MIQLTVTFWMSSLENKGVLSWHILKHETQKTDQTATKTKKKKQQKSAIAFKYQTARKRLDKVPARKMLWTVKKEIIFHCLFHTVFRTTEFSFFEMISITWKKYDSIISLFPSWEEPISLSKIDCLGQKYEVILSSDIDSIGS